MTSFFFQLSTSTARMHFSFQWNLKSSVQEIARKPDAKMKRDRECGWEEEIEMKTFSFVGAIRVHLNKGKESFLEPLRMLEMSRIYTFSVEPEKHSTCALYHLSCEKCGCRYYFEMMFVSWSISCCIHEFCTFRSMCQDIFSSPSNFRQIGKNEKFLSLHPFYSEFDTIWSILSISLFLSPTHNFFYLSVCVQI